MVDAVVATASPLDSWDAAPAVDAPNIVSIDATGWTARAELFGWAADNGWLPQEDSGTGSVAELLPLRARADWMIVDAQSHVICRSTVKDAACAARSLEAGTQAWTGIPGLDVVAGPMNHSAEEAFWTSASSLGAITSRSSSAGAARVATLTLQVAGVPGNVPLVASIWRLQLQDRRHRHADADRPGVRDQCGWAVGRYEPLETTRGYGSCGSRTLVRSRKT